jgi:hypothetical protein
MRLLFFTILLSALVQSAYSKNQDREAIKGRAEFTIYEKCIEIAIFVTNTTEEQIVIVTGVDSNPHSSIQPAFFMGGGRCTPSSITRLTTAAQRPIHTLALNPKKEVKIGTYITLLPKVHGKETVIEPHLYLRTENRDLEYIVNFQRASHVEQAGTGQPATRSQPKSDGGDKPQPESEGRPR